MNFTPRDWFARLIVFMFLFIPWFGSSIYQPLPNFFLPFMNFASANQESDLITIQTDEDPSWAVIWLHGLGADGNDFVPIVKELPLQNAPGIRFLFPHAPIRSITVNGGMRMRGWYDIKSMDLADRVDAAGVYESAEQVEALIAEQVAVGIPESRIILAGFSQGGVIALHTGLHYPKTLGGIIALSTYLPIMEGLEQELADENRNTPLFMAHGSMDPVVPLSLGEGSKNWLEQQGYEVEWHTYPMPHSVAAEEIDHIGRWLSERF